MAKHVPAAPAVLKQTLLENALEHIEEGIARFFSNETPDEKAHKFGLSDLYGGILLLLKERLRRVDPQHIQQPTKNNPGKTVDYHELFKRLGAHAGITLDPADRQLLDTVRAIRNPIEHGEVELALDDAKKMIAALTEFAYIFARDHLQVSLEATLDPETFHRVSQLRKVAERLDADFALYLADWWKGIAYKYTKMSKRKLIALRDIEPYHPKHNPDAEPLRVCETCCEETVVRAEEGAMVCTNPDCRELFDGKNCERCGEPTFDAETPLCSACTDYIFSWGD
jgi:hypothetical protein